MTKKRMSMNKEFSEGFLHDIADLLELCMKRNTDNIRLDFDIDGTTLNVDIAFSVKGNAEGE